MKTKYKFIALLLCIGLVLGGISSAYAIDAQKDTDAKEIRNNSGYLTEQEVFTALAYTYENTGLSDAINEKTSISPNDVPLKSFTAEDYNSFTGDQYGGMYLDEDGVLVLCYTEASNLLKKVGTSVEKSSGRLLNESGKALWPSVVVKSVKYSYADLSNTDEKITSIWLNHGLPGLRGFWISNKDNQIVLEILPGAEGEETKKQLVSMFDSDMLFFVEADPDDQYKTIASIDGTTEIDNGDGSSTPAGQMWSSDKGYYGIITCGHGYEKNDTIYKGSTKIGKIIELKVNSSNDSAFIKLNSGHSYTGTKDDQISSDVPAEGATITLRGFVTGTKSAKVTSNNATGTIDDNGTSISGKNMIKVNKAMQSGDSGGGAIGGVIDGGRTNCIVGINRAASSSSTLLVKGEIILNAY